MKLGPNPGHADHEIAQVLSDQESGSILRV